MGDDNPKETSRIEIRPLISGDGELLSRIAPGVFDHPIDPQSTEDFLQDPRHDLVVAIEHGLIIGAASAVHYVHPDKLHPEMWIDEIGVAATHRGRGVGRALMRGVLEVAWRIGCSEAWVVTERTNASAMKLYAAAGGAESPEDSVVFSFRPGHRAC